MNLRIGNSDLKSSATGKANQDLIANPFGSRGVNIHCVEQTASYRAYRTANDPEQRHDANFRQRKAL